MHTYLDCYPCFLRQALASLRLITNQEAEQKRVLDQVIKTLPTLPMAYSPPRIAKTVYEIVARETGVEDPYLEIKTASNRQALAALPELTRIIAQKPNRLRAAASLAISGNLIDFGVQHEGFKVSEGLNGQIPDHFDLDDFSAFEQQLPGTTKLLYIGDNAGEIVADKIFISQMKAAYPQLEVGFAVRGTPIINDVTIVDAEQVGMAEVAGIINSGCRAPALLEDEMSPEMADWFYHATMIIAKGQGNYEALSQSKQAIFFLLQCKCPVVADDLKVEVGSTIFKYHRRKQGKLK
ncbi:MAG: ARMT1-like domain-containing protein [Pseudomonadota bacterium]|nr:ARMT1-like domain-containing protein [Pseudomonadota bacterium]